MRGLRGDFSKNRVAERVYAGFRIALIGIAGCCALFLIVPYPTFFAGLARIASWTNETTAQNLFARIQIGAIGGVSLGLVGFGLTLLGGRQILTWLTGELTVMVGGC